MLHISLLFSLCAYYNKHFHRDGFLKLFCCYGQGKKKIPKILKQFNCVLFLFFIIPMIGVIASHDDNSLLAIVAFIGIFGLIGLFMSCSQMIITCFDLKNISNYEQQVEKVLIVFVLLSSILFLIIFCTNVCYI